MKTPNYYLTKKTVRRAGERLGGDSGSRSVVLTRFPNLVKRGGHLPQSRRENGTARHEKKKPTKKSRASGRLEPFPR